jgi:glutamate dehydrogenase (NAD(P)+)
MSTSNNLALISNQADELGPEKIIRLYDPETGLQAMVVIDNVAAGPAIGGARMAVDVSAIECVRLARAMTLKNSMAGLPHGGAKSVIAADPSMDAQPLNRLLDSFARQIKDLQDYIPGPDMGTNEMSMARIYNITGRAAGLPVELGGIPLDEIGATAIGIVAAAEAALPFAGLQFEGSRAVIQGFGAVGLHSARQLAARGVRIVGVSDSRGATVCHAGLNLSELLELKVAGESVVNATSGTAVDPDALLGVACDFWIPAARPDVINSNNVAQMETKMVVQGANIPVTLEAEAVLAERGVLVIPDFVANAGGVICASIEYRGGRQSEALSYIRERITSNVQQVLEHSRLTGMLPRAAAESIARARIARAMSWRKPG